MCVFCGHKKQQMVHFLCWFGGQDRQSWWWLAGLEYGSPWGQTLTSQIPPHTRTDISTRRELSYLQAVGKRNKNDRDSEVSWLHVLGEKSINSGNTGTNQKSNLMYFVLFSIKNVNMLKQDKFIWKWNNIFQRYLIHFCVVCAYKTTWNNKK